ncbi:RNA-directed DNA polymerase, eukaryota, reverse transcriptase zinc-binding domain protein [Tanacetum coccineum]
MQFAQKRIDDGIATPSDRDTHMLLLQEIDKLDNFEALDLIQKAHIKWDIEGDENSKFFHGLINQKRRYQSIMHDGVWITDPIHIKELFLNFFKDKFQVHDSQVVFPPLVHSTHLCPLDSEYLENHVSLDEIKSAIWGCGSNKAPNPDGFTFALGFGNKWRSWIRACLHSSRASVLVNGSPTSEFSIKRGLRQGDPLSPFIFILVIEGLRCALSTAVSSNLIHGINLGPPNLTLSHLFYVDNVIITTEWNPGDLDNIIRVLHVFYLASGLKININKSNIYGIGVSDDEVSNMARNPGCAAGIFPFTYLGLPIGSTMNHISSWKTLIDQFQSRLSSSKASHLSIGDRLTLIKVVLGAEEAWETIEDCVQCDKQWKNPTSTISDQTIANLKAQLFENEVVRVMIPKCMSWLDAYDEPIGNMEDKVDNPSPQSTPQVLPSFEIYTPPVTYPKEVDETIGFSMEVEPLDHTKLEDLGLNTCSHDLFLSFREVPNVDEPKP